MFPFLRQTIAAFHTTGAVAPSSAGLARALSAPIAVRPSAVPIEILEAGPGTGALTRGILPHLRPGDRLTLCEINGEFVAHLRRRFESDRAFAPYREQVAIHHGPAEDLGDEARFAHVVCGIPFNNFDPALVERIFATFRRVLLPGGTVNFFEYAAIRRIKRPFVGPDERRRLDAVAGLIGALVAAHQQQARLVLGNLPPAWARSLRF